MQKLFMYTRFLFLIHGVLLATESTHACRDDPPPYYPSNSYTSNSYTSNSDHRFMTNHNANGPAKPGVVLDHYKNFINTQAGQKSSQKAAEESALQKKKQQEDAAREARNAENSSRLLNRHWDKK